MGDGTGSFAAPSSFSSGGEGPIGLASGNFNEDSYPDLAVSHTFSNDITVFLNDGTGTFSALPAFFSGGLGPHTLITGLFNGDGQIDLAVVHFTTGDVDVFIGTGGGNFAPFSSLPGFGTNPRFLTSGDLNGDGNTDLAVAYPNGIIGPYYGNGTGAFAPGTAVSSGTFPEYLLLAHLNGDLYADLVVTDGNAGAVSVFFGASSSLQAGPSFASGATSAGIAVADYSGDGALDLAIANYGEPGSSNIAVHLGDGSGNFSAPRTFASGGIGPYRMVAGDYNGDGLTDLAISHDQSNVIGILLDNNVSNTPPDATLSGPADPVPVSVAVELTINGIDADVTTLAVNWGDGTTTAPAYANGSSTATHTYESTGVYVVSVALTDACGATGSADFRYVVVYDPTAGFVTGGGSIASPPGAYPADEDLIGKATFGFVSKYLKGQIEPNGSTQFEFSLADLHFKSSTYDWLVISKDKAQFKGSGTVNGAGNYGFLLSAVDAQLSSTPGADKFRIKIWNKDILGDENVVYDNQPGAEETAEATTDLSSGSIVIHTPGKNATTGTEPARVGEELPAGSLTLMATPNPSQDYFQLKAYGGSGEPVQVRIVDLLGRVVETWAGLSPQSTLRFGSHYRPGIYMAEVQQGARKQLLKLVKH